MVGTGKRRDEKRRYMATRPNTDPYEVLGIARDADQTTIKSAYRRKAKEHHPDKNRGDASAEERFKEVVEAYEVLSDPEKRELFDLYGNVGPSAKESAWEPPPESPPPEHDEPCGARGQMDDWERVFVGRFNGVDHYHFGPMKVCAGCGLGLGEMGPVDVGVPEKGGEFRMGDDLPTGMRSGIDDTLPGAAHFARKRG